MASIIREALGALICASILFAGTAKAEWSRIESDRFVLIAESPEQDASAILRELSALEIVLNRLTDFSPLAGGLPLSVFYFDDGAHFEKVLPGRDLLGAFVHNYDAVYALARRAEDEKPLSRGLIYGSAPIKGINIIKHEIAHAHMFGNPKTRAAPRWYAEGFAEYFSTLQTADRTARVGAPETNILRTARIIRFPIKDLFEKSYDQLPRDKIYPYSAKAWAVFHYFNLTAERRDLLSALLDIATTEEGLTEEAFQSVTGKSYNGFDRELSNYLRDNIKVRVFTLDSLDLELLPATGITDVEGRIAVLEAALSLAPRSEDRTFALADEAKALASDVQNRSLTSGLELLAAIKKGDFDAAKSVLEWLEANDAHTRTTRYLEVKLAMEEAADCNQTKNEGADALNNADGQRVILYPECYGPANTVAARFFSEYPTDFRGAAAYGIVADAIGRPDDEVLSAFATAYEYAPFMRAIVLRYAAKLAETGDVAAAVSVVEPFLAISDAESDRDFYRGVIEEFKATEKNSPRAPSNEDRN